MDYKYGCEKRLKISYELSLAKAVAQVKTLKGKDIDALASEWYEVLVNEIDDVDIDYLCYWEEWKLDWWRYSCKSNYHLETGSNIPVEIIKESASSEHLKEQHQQVEGIDWLMLMVIS